MMLKLLQSRLTLCDPLDCSLPGSSVHGIFQARVLEWDAVAFSAGATEGPGRTEREGLSLSRPAERKGVRASGLL